MGCTHPQCHGNPCSKIFNLKWIMLNLNKHHIADIHPSYSLAYSHDTSGLVMQGLPGDLWIHLDLKHKQGYFEVFSEQETPVAPVVVVYLVWVTPRTMDSGPCSWSPGCKSAWDPEVYFSYKNCGLEFTGLCGLGWNWLVMVVPIWHRENYMLRSCLEYKYLNYSQMS